MAQITSGLRSVLSAPAVYDLLQDIMGAKSARDRIVRDHIRPFPGMRILDIGSGTSEILDHLPNDIDYVGYDISPAYIERAAARFADRGAFHCRILKEDEARTLAPVDLVMAIGVLHHLDDDEARAFMRIAKAVLKPGGRLFTHDPCFADGQNPFARFLISRDRGQNVREEPGYRALVEPAFSQVQGFLRHQAWIPYTHFAMEAQ